MLDTLEMVGFLKGNGTACRFISLTCRTPVTNIRVSNPFGRLDKVSKKIGIINANYNLSVRKKVAEILGVQLDNVEYENGEVWYKHLLTEDGKSLPLVVNKNHTNQYYLQFFPHKSTSEYVLTSGEVVDSNVVKSYLYKTSEKPAFKPSVISVNLSHICQLKASGVIINMPSFEEAEAILAD